MAKKKRDLWVIEYTSVDPSRDATVAYESRKEAVEAAADFAKKSAEQQLDDIEWDHGSEAFDILWDIVLAASNNKPDDAIVMWLDFQNNYDPEEKIAIGPSGSVSDKPHDFPVVRR